MPDRITFLHSTLQASSIVISICGACARFVAASANLANLAIADAAHRCYMQRQKPSSSEKADEAGRESRRGA